MKKMSERAKAAWAAVGAVAATLASLWIIGVGFYLLVLFYVFAGFFFLLCTAVGIMIYMLRGTKWRP